MNVNRGTLLTNLARRGVLRDIGNLNSSYTAPKPPVKRNLLQAFLTDCDRNSENEYYDFRPLPFEEDHSTIDKNTPVENVNKYVLLEAATPIPVENVNKNVLLEATSITPVCVENVNENVNENVPLEAITPVCIENVNENVNENVPLEAITPVCIENVNENVNENVVVPLEATTPVQVPVSNGIDQVNPSPTAETFKTGKERLWLNYLSKTVHENDDPQIIELEKNNALGLANSNYNGENERYLNDTTDTSNILSSITNTESNIVYYENDDPRIIELENNNALGLANSNYNGENERYLNDTTDTSNILSSITNTESNIVYYENDDPRIIELENDNAFGLANSNYNGENERYLNDTTDTSGTSNNLLNITPTSNESNTVTKSHSRNRKATPKNWIRNKAKTLRQSGQAYIGRGNGKKMNKKEPKECDCSKCRFHCNDNFPEDQRQRLCTEFYKLADIGKQKMYLTTCIESSDVKRPKNNATNHRRVSRSFLLPTGNGTERIRVCRKFFAATFSISVSMVEYTVSNASLDSGVYTQNDRRIGKTPANVIPQESVQFIMNFIDSFPRVPSHYCRKDTKREYLSSELNSSTVYRLYREKCAENKRKPVSRSSFMRLFADHDPPLSFYVPKKDQCPMCNAYKRLKENGIIDEEADNVDELDELLDESNNEDKEFVEEYKQHKEREKSSLKMSNEDNVRAHSDSSFRAISFDLQAILQLPYAAENQLYYTRKLNCYNFTIYDSFEQTGISFLWDECNGSKGSNEIGSCLFYYLKKLPSNVKHVSSFSDTCGGQNRNRNIAAAMMYAIQVIENLEIIDLKFMESGHSYLIADSMHARIEVARKHKQIYTTREYGIVIGCARQNPKPYDVNFMKFSDFFDFKAYSKDNLKNVKNATGTNEVVSWLNIKWLRFEKIKPNIIQFKYDLNANEFFEIDTTISERGRKAANQTVVCKEEPTKAYKGYIPISKEKKSDLLQLLAKRIIPSDYAEFYSKLPTDLAPVENASNKRIINQKRIKSISSLANDLPIGKTTSTKNNKRNITKPKQIESISLPANITNKKRTGVKKRKLMESISLQPVPIKKSSRLRKEKQIVSL